MTEPLAVGDRVALKWKITREGVAPADDARKGTVKSIRPDLGFSKLASPKLTVLMDDTASILVLNESMWRRLDLIERVGEIQL